MDICADLKRFALSKRKFLSKISCKPEKFRKFVFPKAAVVLLIGL